MKTGVRVLFADTISTLEEYVSRRGGEGLTAARSVDRGVLIKELEASGLRGRGGAGFPTGRKWRTMVENRSSVEPTTVVVNGAEGEPGTFKDRSILRKNPYHVVEGALIAALAVGADHVVFALKRSFETEVARVRAAIAEVQAAGWAPGIGLEVFEGPEEYLYGEESALLEAIDGRHPFPRIAPPFRRGVERAAIRKAGEAPGSGLAARVDMAGPLEELIAPPALVDNVETLANVPRIIARGADWFRHVGTPESPGTIVCTVTGATRRHGVAEVIMGTSLRKVIEGIGGGPLPGRRIKAVLPGVSNGIIPEELLDAPVSYEGLAAIGSGLGSGSFIVLDDSVDLAAVAAGVARFLGVESCGQCTPCKHGGLRLADLLGQLSRSEADDRTLRSIETQCSTVNEQARCYLAHQHKIVLQSILARFPDEVQAHLTGEAGPVEPYLIAELVDIVDGVALSDEEFRLKQPDWSHNPLTKSKNPADRFGENRFGDWTFKP
ncbi:MAG: NADH-ubiquinone oxidoreductase-F iron-sulfur binding region domain-containing protein [Acidimicrobiia bacterium]